ncbi:MAG TPA: hypothetical protein VJ983_07210 [candidate division Zixibacteria bacterium]|nr:hypothetical protein [candidate division Zixibacteria bacterium]
MRDALPKVLIPYPGPASERDEQDIFVYLRPETNDVRVEATVLKVVERCPAYKRDMNLVYLANVPGEFITRHHIVEQHYALKLEFAVYGKELFTPYMRTAFSNAFRTSFDGADIIGSFEALRRLKLRPEELFALWVPDEDLFVVDGQSIKRVGGSYVVNYDIPALLHKNSRGTDIAVMIFRVRLGYSFFNDLVEQMRDALIQNGLMSPKTPPSRAFHYSKGPFEQILDGFGYLFTSQIETASLADLTFSTFLSNNGIQFETIRGVVSHPILHFKDEYGNTLEENLFSYTLFDDYQTALRKLNTMVAQVVLPRRGPGRGASAHEVVRPQG